ncbi:MAG: helix-turn-helix domain-containing protein [Acidimicrobiia bacterium]
MDHGIPPFLTVAEAGRLLRIGRTKAYELTRQWRETDGRSGLPVVDLGDVLRVPGPAIERMLATGLGNAGRSDLRGELTPVADAQPAPLPPATSRIRRQHSQPVVQMPLFEASFSSHDPRRPSRR